MPYLDLVDAFDVNFLDPILVVRREQTISDGIVGTYNTEHRVKAVVTSDGDNSLDRGEDAQSAPKTISVITRFGLRGVSSGHQPDIVVWHGDKFVVIETEDYKGFGRKGWIEATASSIDAVDGGQIGGVFGQFDFSKPIMSGLITCL